MSFALTVAIQPRRSGRFPGKNRRKAKERAAPGGSGPFLCTPCVPPLKISRYLKKKHLRCRCFRGPAPRGGAFAPYKRFGRRPKPQGELAAGQEKAAWAVAEAEFTSAEHFKIPRYPKKSTGQRPVLFLEATPGFEPGNQGFADPRLTTWLCRHIGTGASLLLFLSGAGDEARTRYLHLGKVALYQMSYARRYARINRAWCLRSESNQRHEDFQSSALPTELQRHMATEKGLEPSTSSVTGWRSNQLNYSAICMPFLYKTRWWEQQGSNL